MQITHICQILGHSYLPDFSDEFLMRLHFRQHLLWSCTTGHHAECWTGNTARHGWSVVWYFPTQKQRFEDLPVKMNMSQRRSPPECETHLHQSWSLCEQKSGCHSLRAYNRIGPPRPWHLYHLKHDLMYPEKRSMGPDGPHPPFSHVEMKLKE